MRFYQTSDFHGDLNVLVSPKNTSGRFALNQREPVLFYDWSYCDPELPIFFIGDTANDAKIAIEIFEEARRYFAKVFFTDGNHDSYTPNTRTLEEVRQMYRDYAGQYQNVHYMEPGVEVQLGDTLIIGGAGWYTWSYFNRENDYERWKNEMNDYRFIRFDHMPDRLASRHMHLLADSVQRAQSREDIKEILVFTHMIPDRAFAYPWGHPKHILNGSYVNDMAYLVRDADVNHKIAHWGFGHTHVWHDRNKDGIRYVSCARGYQGEVLAKSSVPVLINTEDRFVSVFQQEIK